MNRYLKRGLIALIAGIALNVGGYMMMTEHMDYYGWLMIFGVILFGIGFVLSFYSIFRKVEAQGLIEERAEQLAKRKRFRLGWGKHKHVSAV